MTTTKVSFFVCTVFSRCVCNLYCFLALELGDLVFHNRAAFLFNTKPAQPHLLGCHWLTRVVLLTQHISVRIDASQGSCARRTFPAPLGVVLQVKLLRWSFCLLQPTASLVSSMFYCNQYNHTIVDDDEVGASPFFLRRLRLRLKFWRRAG